MFVFLTIFCQKFSKLYCYCKLLYIPDNRGHNFGNRAAGDCLLSCPRPLSTRTTGIPKTRYSITVQTRKAAPPFISHSTGNTHIPCKPATCSISMPHTTDRLTWLDMISLFR
jgi:hypothetical protein